jgi:hypothetical protein
MALAKKPTKITPIKPSKAAKAAKFAAGPATAPESGDGADRDLTQVIIRLDRKLLERIDRAGRALGFQQRAPFMLTTLVDRVRKYENEGT